MIAIGAASIYFAASSVFAEDIENITEQAILNFNQIIQDTYTNNYNYIGNSTPTTSNVSVASNSKLYIRFVSSNSSLYLRLLANNLQDVIFDFTNNNVSIIVNTSVNINSLQLFTTGDINITYFYIINLTQMFGETLANTITVEQCNNIFVADYYPYNTGSPITYSNITAYAQGVESVLQSMETTIETLTIINNAQPYYSSYYDSFIQYYSMTGNYPEIRYTDTLVFYNACFIPLLTTLYTGDSFNLSADLISDYSFANIQLAIYSLSSDNQLTLIDTLQSDSNDWIENYSKDFIISANDSVGIVITNTLGQDASNSRYLEFNNINIKYQSRNLTNLLANSYSQGANDLTTYYSQGNLGYETIYTIGFNDGVNMSNSAITSMDYIKSAFITLGDILAIQVFPNVPLGTFFLLPLMASLIFFIVKVSKGG